MSNPIEKVKEVLEKNDEYNNLPDANKQKIEQEVKDLFDFFAYGGGNKAENRLQQEVTFMETLEGYGLKRDFVNTFTEELNKVIFDEKYGNLKEDDIESLDLELKIVDKLKENDDFKKIQDPKEKYEKVQQVQESLLEIKKYLDENNDPKKMNGSKLLEMFHKLDGSLPGYVPDTFRSSNMSKELLSDICNDDELAQKINDAYEGRSGYKARYKTVQGVLERVEGFKGKEAEEKSKIIGNFCVFANELKISANNCKNLANINHNVYEMYKKNALNNLKNIKEYSNNELNGDFTELVIGSFLSQAEYDIVQKWSNELEQTNEQDDQKEQPQPENDTQDPLTPTDPNDPVQPTPNYQNVTRDGYTLGELKERRLINSTRTVLNNKDFQKAVATITLGAGVLLNPTIAAVAVVATGVVALDNLVSRGSVDLLDSVKKVISGVGIATNGVLAVFDGLLNMRDNTLIDRATVRKDQEYQTQDDERQ